MALNVSDPAARQYAKALLEIGTSSNTMGRIYDELNAVTSAYKNDKTFRSFFTSPKVPSETKARVIDSGLGKEYSDSVRHLLGLLIRRRRESLLDNIMDAFARYRDEAEHRVHVVVESARPLDDATRKDLLQRVAASTGREVALHEVVNESLIGGMRVRVGDRLLDASLSRKLRVLSHLLAARESGGGFHVSEADIESLYAGAKA